MNNFIKSALFLAATALTACGTKEDNQRTPAPAQAPAPAAAAAALNSQQADLIRVDLGNDNGSGQGGLIRVDLGGGRWCNRGYCGGR